VEEERLKSILESLLFAAGEPVSLAKLAAIFEDVPRVTIQKTLAAMTTAYASENRGITIDEVAGGYQMRTAKEHSAWVRKLLAAKPPRLSRPLLETAAIVAYRQPITRPEIEQLRGVDSGGVLETLLERRLIRIEGRKEAPGRPIVYGTTPEFLELFGLKDLESLPDLSEFREIERAVEQAETKPIESVEKMPDEDALAGTDTRIEVEANAEPTDEAVETADESSEQDEPKPRE
jgi:segregation and condensation protein B